MHFIFLNKSIVGSAWLTMKVSRAGGWPPATWAVGVEVRPGEDSPPGREPAPRPTGGGRAEKDEETESGACLGPRRAAGRALSVSGQCRGHVAGPACAL